MILQGEKERSEHIHYEVDPSGKPIGIGGMGRVYKGVCVNEQTREAKPVAIKFMFEDLPAHAVERARREASIQLRSDQLVEMLGFIETSDETGNGNRVKHYHVVSELLHGVSLSDVLEGKDTDFEGNTIPFAKEMYQLYKEEPEKFALIIIKNVLSGLMSLHDNGYIHRDIDPSNIMLTSDRHVKLIDFGIAKKINLLATGGNEMNVKERLVGKIKYAAPELVQSDIAHQNRTTDIYAVGILLYQLICGHLPFDGSEYEVMQMQIKKKVPLNEIENPMMRKVIKRATEKKQSKRYQTASEFRVALEEEHKDSKSTILIFYAIMALLGLLIGVALKMFL